MFIKQFKLLVASLMLVCSNVLVIPMASATQVKPPCPTTEGYSEPGESGNCKVTICHRKEDVKKPYVQITVDESAVDGVAGNSGQEPDHFGEHKGPIATSEAVAQGFKDSHTEWGDIIPPTTAQPDGLNWTDEGKAIYRNGCNFVTGGQGGGNETPPTTTTTTTGSVLGTSITQVAQAPQGGVGAGEGGAAKAVSATGAAGLAISMTSAVAGLAWMARRKALGL